MASDRDTLAELLHEEGAFCGDCSFEDFCPDCTRIRGAYADAIMRAGWRPPAQVITDPAALDALPDDSIVVDHHNAGWQMTDRDYDGTAIWTYHTTARSSAELLGAGARVTVAYVPTEEATDE